MDKENKLPCWAALSILVALVLVGLLIIFPPTKSDQVAAWVQAFGTIVAIGAAIRIGDIQHKNNLKLFNKQLAVEKEKNDNRDSLELFASAMTLGRVGEHIGIFILELSKAVGFISVRSLKNAGDSAFEQYKIKRIELKIGEDINYVEFKDFQDKVEYLYTYNELTYHYLGVSLEKLEAHKYPTAFIADHAALISANYQTFRFLVRDLWMYAQTVMSCDDPREFSRKMVVFLRAVNEVHNEI